MEYGPWGLQMQTHRSLEWANQYKVVDTYNDSACSADLRFGADLLPSYKKSNDDTCILCIMFLL